jgi:DhnA family fructose-bisphosphate aldolase class Ia
MNNKTLRLQKLFHPVSGRAIMLPFDHGVTQGPIDGLRHVPDLISLATRSKLQAVIAHKGTIRWALQQGRKALGTEYILHLSASTSMSSDPSNKQIVTGLQHALQIGVTGISLHVNLGVPEEPAMLRDLGMICDEAYNWGMPVLAMVNVHESLISNNGISDSRIIAHAVRVAGELGADIVKVYYPGRLDHASDVVSAFDIPVLLAGGNKIKDKLEWFKSIHNYMTAGGKGICAGRNVFTDEHPDAMCFALTGLVHENKTPQEAYEAYRGFTA